MNTIFVSSEDNKISGLHRLLLDLKAKTNLKKNNKYTTLLNLAFYFTMTYMQTINLKR